MGCMSSKSVGNHGIFLSLKSGHFSKIEISKKRRREMMVSGWLHICMSSKLIK